MPNNATRTAIGCNNISDKILSLMTEALITADIQAAAQHFTYFKFDVTHDSEFYTSSTVWREPLEEQRAIAKKVIDRFNTWYGQASVSEKVFTTIAALTDTSEQIDNMLLDAYSRMQEVYRVTMYDSDGTHFTTDDYHAMRLDANLDAALKNYDWWCPLVEQQVQRILACPRMLWTEFVQWNNRREEAEDALTAHCRSLNRLQSAGLTPKQSRRIFNRSLNLFTQMYGKNTARKFLRGKNLWIHGQHFVWKLKLDDPSNIIHDTVKPSQTHTPFVITICNQQMEKLCNACVLFDKTPVLDQAVAFGLMVAHPEDELEFLQKTNLFAFTEIGRINELLLSQPHAMVASIDHLRRYVEEYDTNVEVVHIAEDTTIDDGIDPDATYPYDTTDDYYDDYRSRFTDDRIYNDDIENAYSSETDTHIPLLIRHSNGLTDLQREQIQDLYGAWRKEHRLERRWRYRHPIISRLKEKLFAKLDVDPDILRYMQFPEFHFQYLPKITSAPRLEAWISARVPLFERNF